MSENEEWLRYWNGPGRRVAVLLGSSSVDNHLEEAILPLIYERDLRNTREIVIYLEGVVASLTHVIDRLNEETDKL